jgi:AI-2 transport protein TqsA
MSQSDGFSAGARIIITMAAFVVVVAGMKAAATLMVTFLLAAFIAILCAPPFILMQRYGVPSWISILVIVAFLLLLQVGFITIVASTIANFTSDLPEYQQKLRIITVGLITQLNSWGFNIPEGFVRDYLDPGTGFRMAANVLTNLGAVFSNAFLILLAVLFMLFEGASIPRKLQMAFGNDKPLAGADRFLETVKRYMNIKSAVSLVTGVMVYIWLVILSVDYAMLWGLIAFMFNYVPSIGSAIAAVPAVLLALVQLGWVDAALVAMGYLVINVALGNLIEPRIMGRGMGLSTLVVFLSLVFWGWILGPVGMLLSVPLTMLLKIAFEANADTRWIAILLGPDISEPAPRRRRSVLRTDDAQDRPRP